MAVDEFGIIWSDKNLQFAMFCIIFNPIYWNVVARLNYYTKFLEKIFESKKIACSVFAVTIILLGFYRDWLFTIAMKSQPANPMFDSLIVHCLGWLLIAIGTSLVLSAFFALGFYGCFLGDYFGILLPEKVTAFPFNIFNNPMYFGSFLNFLGTSLLYNSESGIFLSILVALVYSGMLIFET
ncbi:hypothetical protein HELRODRAFT_81871 [Helobdella robusta]|uniref:Phosphatidylethanolamine N-methyltransferase n=1 Tax=Helobdella robusta TaxID=6412 RepID=T1G4J9_HELRO|nr:hypothetical protein HELRODRAFT_81871 [Helobdella robusta]ESO01236.1 hypothetical protein HELRODRAFT_81871 [Helobdella robusta]